MKHKMWSRLLSMMLAVMMIASIVPNSAFAEAASEIAASSQAAVEVVEETEEVTLPEEEVPASEAPAEEPVAVEPTAEPAPTEEPVAEPTAEPVTENEQPTAEPTQAPAETVAPSEEPSAEPSAAPEATEAPNASAQPSETPAASATPAPSESPVPSETPAPSEEPAIDGQALLDELMAIEDDEAFLKAVSELTEEQTAALEALGEEALAEYTLRVEQIDLSKLLDELAAMDDDAFVEKFASLTDEEKAALNELNADVYAELEARYNLLTYVSPVFSVNGTQPVPFLQVGPLVENAGVPMTMMSRSAPMLRNSGTGTSEAEGIEVNKTATANTDGTYTLNLEAYATGDLKIVTESKPTDIVLVLDQSGSMADPFEYDYKVTYEIFDGTYSEAYRNPTYHLASDGSYHELNVSREWKWGGITAPTGFEFTFSCDTCEATIHTKKCWLFGWTTSVDENSGVFKRVAHSTTISRVNALKDAVNSFVESVREDASTNGVDHKIAIVGFASQSGYGNNTEILSIAGNNSEYGSGDNDSVGKAYNQLTTEDYKAALTGCNEKILDNAINAIATNGATRADLGMEMAKKILNENPTNGERNQVVILFTDGEPTSGNQFENGVANGAINNAKAIKENNATVYTIGIFNNANVEGNDNPNRYMQYVSSNYPDATSMGNYGNGNDKGGYYLVAKDAGELEDIFEKISGEVGGTSSTLDEKAVLRDVISPYFEMVYKDGKPDVKVFTADCTGKTGTKYTFGESTQVTDDSIKATVSSDGTTVDVTGFNYKENFVGEVKDGDKITYRGTKLMVQITIKQKDAFLGGNNVPTNVPETSGIYKDNQESTPVKTFPQPTVDVPLKYTATKNDKTIYLSNNANLVDLVNETTAHYADLGRGAHANDYAKITYTFTAGSESWSYVIDPKADKGTWANDNSGAAVSPDKCTEYTVAVKVEPSVSKEGGVDNEKINLKPQIHVVAPEIWWQDSTAKYGQKLDGTYYEQNNLVPNKLTWTKHVNDNAADCSGTPTVSGNEPTLIYQYTATGKDGTTTLKSLTEEANVKVSVFVGAVADENNITSKVKFKWEDCAVAGCDTDPNPAFQFRVHLDSGKLTITKTVTDWNNAKGDQATFFFEITDVNGKIYEQALTVSKTNKTATATMTLPAGTYTVEELNGTSGYQFSGSTLVYAGGTAGEAGEQSVSGVQVGGAVPTVTFTNTTNGDNNPGDNGALNNWFKHDGNSWIWKLGGWNENVAG